MNSRNKAKSKLKNRIKFFTSRLALTLVVFLVMSGLANVNMGSCDIFNEMFLGNIAVASAQEIQGDSGDAGDDDTPTPDGETGEPGDDDASNPEEDTDDEDTDDDDTPTPEDDDPTPASEDEDPIIPDYSDIEAFPESYQKALKALKDAHPTWYFQPMYTGLEWSAVIKGEMAPGRSLVQSSKGPNWGTEQYSPGWNVATQDAVEYCVDPRNWLTEQYVFMFEQLTFNETVHKLEPTLSIIKGSFMDSTLPGSDPESTYAENFVTIGAEVGVSSFHLASRALQEQGRDGTSPLISGTYPGYEGYYNYYNISAAGKTNEQIIISGLKKAVAEGWTSPYLSIKGGAEFLAKSYILKGQDTLYLEKFDVDKEYYGVYSHQYMQSLHAPSSESKSVYKGYKEIDALENTFVFKIPVYNGMPNTACLDPDVKAAVPGKIREFVTRLYQVCLDRDPDYAGLEDWSSNLANGTITGSQAAYGFIFSPEFKNHNYCNVCFVEHLYNAFLGRTPDAGGKQYWLDKLESGVTREEVFNGFALSTEFGGMCEEASITLGTGIDIPEYGTIPTGPCSGCGEVDGVTAFVTRLYNVCLDRNPDAGGLQYWCEYLWSREKTGSEVAYGFIFSVEFTEKDYENDVFVEYLYTAFFGRASDAGGKEYWLNKLSEGASREEVFYGFSGSDEFKKLCAKYGIIAG